jgi:putative flippase GtrA
VVKISSALYEEQSDGQLSALELSRKYQEGVVQFPCKSHLFRQISRFALIGGLNTLLDLLILNGLLWFFPTSNSFLILLYTIFAYSFGAVQSFLLNKYWTFQRHRPTTWMELMRFTITTLFGLAWNCAFIWLASIIAHPFVTNPVVWTNIVRMIAIGSASMLSFLGMRLWVFVHTPLKEQAQ